MKTKPDATAIQSLFDADPERTLRADDIRREIGLRGKNARDLDALLRTLVVDGTVVELRPGVFGLGRPADLVTGKLALVRSGAGFVDDKAGGGSVRIQADELGTALAGDTVVVRRHRLAGVAEARGKVIRIVERAGHDIVGTLFSTGRFLYVVPLDPVYRQDFVVPDARGAAVGDRVVMRFVDWPNRHVAPEGEIVDVIGPADKPSLDTDVICRQYDLPGDFPARVMREAERVAARIHEPGTRLDLRADTYILTVDPAKARDFDDALSLTRDDAGRRVLGVHIADVSHFVQPGTALDVEAADRATSVYLVDKVIPMLPEQLSNGECSLRPDEDRLCFSAFLTFDDAGIVVARRFARTLIRSRLRLSYEQAMAILDGRPPEGLAQVPAEAAQLLKETQALARQLRRRRFQQGALNLEVPECEVQLDADGRMTGVHIGTNDESHQLIEECMVAANEAVATELSERGIRILARLHEPPDPEKLAELGIALKLLGFEPGNLNDPRRLARFLADTMDHPLRHHAHSQVLRSMKRAIYSAADAGHFGLAKRFYSHFTSPIRRYPDLVLHRQLADFLAGTGRHGARPSSYLQATAALCTEREQRADDASRALIEIKKFRFLQQQLDEQRPLVYAAAISRVTNFGLFVDVTDLQMTGLVHITAISQQFVRYDAATETLSVADRAYRLGQAVRVQVVRVDFNQRRADFVLVEEDAGTSHQARPPRGKSGGRRQAEAAGSGTRRPAKPARTRGAPPRAHGKQSRGKTAAKGGGGRRR